MPFRHVVKFMQDDTPDGTQDPNYVDFVTDIPCDIWPKGGGEKFRGRQLEATTTLVIETRFNEAYTPTMIVVNQVTGEEYLINKLWQEHGRRRVQILECVEAFDG